jgi:hypothetical protein
VITAGQLPVPRLRATATCGPWTALVIDVDGRQAVPGEAARQWLARLLG